MLNYEKLRSQIYLIVSNIFVYNSNLFKSTQDFSLRFHLSKLFLIDESSILFFMNSLYTSISENF